MIELNKYLFKCLLGHCFEAQAEIDAFFSERPPDAARVLVMRHAMGAHNTYAGKHLDMRGSLLSGIYT